MRKRDRESAKERRDIERRRGRLFNFGVFEPRTPVENLTTLSILTPFVQIGGEVVGAVRGDLRAARRESSRPRNVKLFSS